MGGRHVDPMAVLGPHLDSGVPLSRAAKAAGVPIRTARRWLAAYRGEGPVALTPRARGDHGRRRTPPELVALIEGLALRKPPPSLADVCRQVALVAVERGLHPPSYTTVRSVVAALDPGLSMLAHRGSAAYRDRFELVYRREAGRPNEMWQADHTELDVMILDPSGRPARPWLTVILDDHSRAVAGYTVFLGAPSAMQTALALRQAIWRKADPTWEVCGLPDTLYADHGADFTSSHLAQVCHDTRIHLIHSTAGVPQGRGKIERFFGTVTTELLPTFTGHIPHGTHAKPITTPTMSLAELDVALGQFFVHDYHQRIHSETGESPARRWGAGGWLPRMPDSLEDLDLLLLTVARPRIVHRDGVHCHGLRYLDLTLSAYVGEAVEIRYDPRDLAEVRVYHQGRFLCRAVAPELASATISLKDLQAARTARRRQLRSELRERRSLVDALTGNSREPIPPGTVLIDRQAEGGIAQEGNARTADAQPPARRRLRLYRED